MKIRIINVNLIYRDLGTHASSYSNMSYQQKNRRICCPTCVITRQSQHLLPSLKGTVKEHPTTGTAVKKHYVGPFIDTLLFLDYFRKAAALLTSRFIYLVFLWITDK